MKQIEIKDVIRNDVCTITRYGADKYDIYWHNGDCSVLGSATEILDEYCCGRLAEVKAFAYENWASENEEDKITVEHPCYDLTTVWMDDSWRFELSDVGAIEQWGMETVFEFCKKVLEVSL